VSPLGTSSASRVIAGREHVIGEAQCDHSPLVLAALLQQHGTASKQRRCEVLAWRRLSAGYLPFFTTSMVSLEAPKKRSACGAESAIWLMMLYFKIRPTRMEPKSTASLMFESFAKKISG